MISLLAALSLLGTPGADLPTAQASEAAGAPVRLWMNRDRVYREGEAVRLQVDTDVDGYLLVLNYDTDGRVRVLFPLDPRDDAEVNAGRRYEVRDGDGRQALRRHFDGAVAPRGHRSERQLGRHPDRDRPPLPESGAGSHRSRAADRWPQGIRL
ncbi:MAG: hypothetical protein DMD43_01905 [Gemmatimonadetes bacterium]|nr:MAG: hypothetical protein DMD43_01905 [Gemmatimonadota bacterium]